jgi:tripartite-type tricarboxylate transporter receptor subunit TctC
MGTTTHALFESWRDAASVDIGCIPYKGGVDLTTAILGGHIDLGVSAIAPAIGLISATTDPIKGGAQQVITAAQ